MIFGAFTEDELLSLRKDRKTFMKTGDLGRGGQFQTWMKGSMKGVGSRMPSGGRAGDTYTVYPGMAIRPADIQKVKQLFGHARVSNHIEHLGRLKIKDPRILKSRLQRWLHMRQLWYHP